MINFGLLQILWPFLAIVLGILLIKFIFQDLLPWLVWRWKVKRRFDAGKEWRSDQDLLRWLRGMKPSEFEEYIAALFSKMKYKTSITGGPGDGGIDIVAEKDGVKHYIQCKKFITSEVSVGAMRDFYGAIASKGVNAKSYFITTNKFTLEAERFAEDKPIELVDEFKLIKYIRSVENAKK